MARECAEKCLEPGQFGEFDELARSQCLAGG